MRTYYVIDICNMFFDQINYIFTAVHFLAFGGLVLYGLHRLFMLFCWAQERKKKPIVTCTKNNLTLWPVVTIQLPLFNERFVAKRLIDATANIMWPKEKFEIQVLDDSTDDTKRIVDERVNFWSHRGVMIKVLRRGHRNGYKAGALAYGLQHAQGKFIAVFDADFVPPNDFLEKTVRYFSDKNIGMVQARWGFFNDNHSWITRIQALLLGPHFSIEHWVRFRRGLFFNFNGTAGIWRREAIETSGGWQSDTVTEDLDLSYRAQIKGWKFIYLDDLVVHSELPVTVASFRNQQQRWAKGSIQTARKILPLIMKSSLPVQVKIESVAHLMANYGWLFGAIITLTLFPTILWRIGIGPYELLRIDLPLFLVTTIAILMYFFIYARAYKTQSMLTVLMLPLVSIGMAPSFALAVIEGIFSKGGVFERTPKYGIESSKKMPRLAFLYSRQSGCYMFLNILLCVYCILPIMYAWERETWFAIPFMLLFPLGFVLILYHEYLEKTST